MNYRSLFLTCLMDSQTTQQFEQLFDGTKAARTQLDKICSNDVVLFNGGTDVNPELYGEKLHPFSQKPDLGRDEFERMVFRRAQAVGAACLGICRGAQLLTVLSGGKLIQHVTEHGMRSHHVWFDRKEGITGLPAASDHHQMMYPYDTNYELIAWAEQSDCESFCEYGKTWDRNKQPEIVWYPDTRSLCIQAHPEWMPYDSLFAKACRDLVRQYIFGEG